MKNEKGGERERAFYPKIVFPFKFGAYTLFGFILHKEIHWCGTHWRNLRKVKPFFRLQLPFVAHCMRFESALNRQAHKRIDYTLRHRSCTPMCAQRKISWETNLLNEWWRLTLACVLSIFWQNGSTIERKNALENSKKKNKNNNKLEAFVWH